MHFEERYNSEILSVTWVHKNDVTYTYLARCLMTSPLISFQHTILQTIVLIYPYNRLEVKIVKFMKRSYLSQPAVLWCQRSWLWTDHTDVLLFQSQTGYHAVINVPRTHFFSIPGRYKKEHSKSKELYRSNYFNCHISTYLQ